MWFLLLRACFFTDYFLSYISFKKSSSSFSDCFFEVMWSRQRKETLRLWFTALCCAVVISKASDFLFSAQALWCLGRSAAEEGTLTGNICTILHFSPTNKTKIASETVPWCPQENVDDISSFYQSLLVFYSQSTCKKSFIVFLLVGEFYVSRTRQVVWTENQIWGYRLSFLTFFKERSPFG